MKYALIATVCLVMVIPIITMIKKGSFLKSLFISAFQGLASLLAVNALGLLTGITVAINWYTVAASVCLGLPACLSLLILDIIF